MLKKYNMIYVVDGTHMLLWRAMLVNLAIQKNNVVPLPARWNECSIDCIWLFFLEWILLLLERFIVTCTWWPSWALCDPRIWQENISGRYNSGSLHVSVRRVDMFKSFVPSALVLSNILNTRLTKEPTLNCRLLSWYFGTILIRTWHVFL